MNDVDRTLAAVAASQRQVFTRAQASEAGLTEAAISRRTTSGLFVPCGTRTLHFAGVALDWRGRLLAGLLELGRSAAVSGRPAAALHTFDGFAEGPLEFLVPRAHRNRRTNGSVSSTPFLAPLDTVTVDGLRVTSGTRTIL